MSTEDEFKRYERKAYRFAVLLFTLLLIVVIGSVFMLKSNFFGVQSQPKTAVNTPIKADEDGIKNGIHLRTGLIDAEGLMTVVNNCTNCHSSKIIIQNRMNAERWNATIKWMQETQNLWDLGGNQEIIVNYLVTNYPLKGKGRRENLSDIDWYELKN